MTKAELQDKNRRLRIALEALSSQAFQVTRVCPDYKPAREMLYNLMRMADEELRA
jgi:hypothetical protein